MGCSRNSKHPRDAAGRTGRWKDGLSFQTLALKGQNKKLWAPHEAAADRIQP